MSRFIEVNLAGRGGRRTINADHIVLVRPSEYRDKAEVVLTNGKDLALQETYDDVRRLLAPAEAFVPPF